MGEKGHDKAMTDRIFKTWWTGQEQRIVKVPEKVLRNLTPDEQVRYIIVQRWPHLTVDGRWPDDRRFDLRLRGGFGVWEGKRTDIKGGKEFTILEVTEDV